jgi:hypothetical protein
MKKVFGLLLIACAAAASAQTVPASADSASARAEAAFQSARTAPSAADRESRLSDFVIDYPFSSRLPDALYELGTLELARSERDRAATHFARFLSLSPVSDSARVPAALALGRLLLERGDLPRGCAALLVGRSEVPESAIETKTQFDFSIGRCQGVDTIARPEPPPPPDTAPAPRRTGAFTVQVAAYDTKKAADRLAKTLASHGLEARVVGTSKPFRVRVGRYATRADAEEASRDVDKVAKSKSIVVVVGPEEK